MTRQRRWDVLATLVNQMGWERGAEVGVFKGRTFKHVLQHCPGLVEYVGVDLWNTDYYHSTRAGRPPKEFDLDAEYAQLSKWCAAHDDRFAASLLRMNTIDAAALFEDGFFDFAFIDADHRYDAVKADIAAWKPKAKVICGHDYNREEFPGVVQAVNEAFAEVKLYDDHVWLGVS